MTRDRWIALASSGLLTAAMLSGITPAGAVNSHASSRAVCPAANVGAARCKALVVTDARGNPMATSSYRSGLRPVDLQSAYNLSSASAGSGSGQTIAIVDAYNDPTAEADLGVYRQQWGLSACTTANGCFRKLNQRGGTSVPRTNTGWAQEISLDLDMASAICPRCNILLVETDSNTFANLAAGVNKAAALGANTISNSYGGSDTSSTNGGAYNHPGIAITASSGDNGYGVESPASYNTVVAVGGTSLRTAATPRGWTESAWSGAGSGCSAYWSKPSWQTDAGCANRAVADVSAVADPATGVAVYDSTKAQGVAGWMVFGGTSASSPIIAGVYALHGGHAAGASPAYPASTAYSSPASIYDVTSGSNGTCSASAAYLCTAGPGYDGPTGVGTPNGTGGF